MALCEKCANGKSFGNKCWFYWDGKKCCSQFKKSHDDDPCFMEESD